MQPKGFAIEFYLKHGLNSPVIKLVDVQSFENENNVIDLSEKRQKKSEVASAASESGNLPIAGSQVVGIGSQDHTSPELFQPHRNIELSTVESQRISEKMVELYDEGLSLKDICKRLISPNLIN